MMKHLLSIILINMLYSQLIFAKPVCAVVSPYLPMFSSKGESDVLLKGPVEAMKKFKIYNKASVYLSTANEFDLMTTVNRAYDNGCRVIVGLYTSRECLLAAKILTGKEVILMSPTCGHDDLHKYGGIIYTGVPSIEQYAKKEAEYLDKQSFNKIYIVSNPTDIYSQNTLKFLKQYIKSKITLVPINRNGTILKKIEIEPKSVIVFTTYPKDSGPAIDTFSTSINAKKTPIIAGPSWKYDLNIINSRKAELKKFKSVQIVEIINDSKNEIPSNLKNLSRGVQNIVMASYDISAFASTCYLKNEVKFSLPKFKNCLENYELNGITGLIKFNKYSPFADRKIGLTEFTEVNYAN